MALVHVSCSLREEIVRLTQVGQLLSPFTAGLNELGISCQLVPDYTNNYYHHFTTSFRPLPYGPFPAGQLLSSRLISRTTFATQPAAISQALRATVEDANFYLGCLVLNVSTQGPKSGNAVNSAWRDALSHCIVVGDWDWSIPRAEMEAHESELTNVIMPRLVANFPGIWYLS